MKKGIWLISCFVLVFSSVYAGEKADLAAIVKEASRLEVLSPSLFEETIGTDGKQLLQLGDQAEDYQLSLYGSKLIDSAIDSYEDNKVAIANKKHALLDQYFKIALPKLNVWKVSSHIELGKVDFARWLYTQEAEYKKRAEAHFQTAEALDIAALKKEVGSRPYYIGSLTLAAEQHRQQKLSPAQLYQADKASSAAYQHIAVYEWALKTEQENNLKMSQKQKANLVREAIQVYKESNQRLQPNTLSRAYWGILSSARSGLDKVHFAEFLDSYAQVHKKDSLSASNKDVLDILEYYVNKRKKKEVLYWLKVMRGKNHKLFQASRRNLKIESYLKVCTYPLQHRAFSLGPIFEGIAEKWPEVLAKHSKKNCQLLKGILMEEGKWHYFLI